jgi:hypothetical protein
MRLRIPQCLDNGVIDGGEDVSPKHRSRSTPQKYYFFCRLSKPQGPGALSLTKIRPRTEALACQKEAQSSH